MPAVSSAMRAWSSCASMRSSARGSLDGFAAVTDIDHLALVRDGDPPGLRLLGLRNPQPQHAGHVLGVDAGVVDAGRNEEGADEATLPALRAVAPRGRIRGRA